MLRYIHIVIYIVHIHIVRTYYDNITYILVLCTYFATDTQLGRSNFVTGGSPNYCSRHVFNFNHRLSMCCVWIPLLCAFTKL